MICPNCKRVIPEYSRVCAFCGYDIFQSMKTGKKVFTKSNFHYESKTWLVFLFSMGIPILYVGVLALMVFFLSEEVLSGPYITFLGYKIQYTLFPYLVGGIASIVAVVLVTIVLKLRRR